MYSKDIKIMPSFRTWIVFLSVIMTHGATFKQYDMGEICGRTVSMNDDGIYGFETLMHMTAQLSGTGGCNLTLEKRTDYAYLHFYFSSADLPDCDKMSLYIKEGDTVKSTVQHDDIPRLCGPTSVEIVGDHYSSSKRYLALQLTWNSATTFRGTVFRLVANSYTCDEKCDSGQDKCDDGPCIYSYLNTTSGHDFCGGPLLCTTASDSDTNSLSTFVGIPSSFFIIIFIVFFCHCGFKRGRFSSSGSRSSCDVSSCLPRCCDCVDGACNSCKQSCERCCERTAKGLSDTKHRLTECRGRIEDNWSEFSCLALVNGNDPVVTEPPPSTVMTEVTANTETVTVDDETVANNSYNISSYSNTGGEYPGDNSTFGGGATDDPSAPPPSYTAAMRTRPIPPAPLAPPPETPTEDPPSYEAAIDSPAFEPPDYNMVMANKTFYDAKT